MLSQEDLNTLRSQNYQLIFNIGVPYSGKKTQCEKIANEFKYSRINMKEIIQKEINSKTNLGIQIKQSLENKEPIKTDILTSILISSIIESPELSIMIEGFPNTLEEALYKGLIAAGYKMTKQGGVFITVRNPDKGEIGDVAKKYDECIKLIEYINTIYDLEYDSNDNVTVYIISNKLLKDTKPTWKLDETQTVYSKAFTGNISYLTDVVDINGNQTSVSIIIDFFKNTYKGIDISEYQKIINWGTVKDSGIDFAIIRVGYRGYRAGTIVEDRFFERNIIEATRVRNGYRSIFL